MCRKLMSWISNHFRSTISDTMKFRIGAKGVIFQAWAHEQVPQNSQWLVLKVGGANFLHYQVTDSIQLEHPECLSR